MKATLMVAISTVGVVFVCLRVHAIITVRRGSTRHTQYIHNLSQADPGENDTQPPSTVQDPLYQFPVTAQYPHLCVPVGSVLGSSCYVVDDPRRDVGCLLALPVDV